MYWKILAKTMGGPVSLASESQARILNLSGEAGGSSRSLLDCSIQTFLSSIDVRLSLPMGLSLTLC